MATTTPAFHVTRDRFHLAWDPAIPAIATVGSGSVVTFDCLDASGGQLTAASTLYNVARGAQLFSMPLMGWLYLSYRSFAPALWVGALCALLSAVAASRLPQSAGSMPPSSP